MSLNEERKSRISSIQLNKGISGQIYDDFIPEDDENLEEDIEDADKKFSIRALNFKMMSRIPMNTLLARASSRLLSSGRNRGTISSRFTNQMRKGS